ncbi:MHCK/EF2 kinase, partial [Suillus tomentosus]
VQQYIATELVTRSTPPFKIPNIRFVHIALATIEDAGVTKTYLIEEFIDESTQGKFTKYISNDSPSPLPHLDANSSEIAQYLSFAQHVQYIKTKKLAYIADFQGSRNLLTDPQIMTSPDLSGHLFADGNLASAFSSFAEKHQCNMFCEFFKLP